jgi:hypothetical protein
MTQETDRELLEYVAKANNYKFSDIEFRDEYGLQIVYPIPIKNWNPLTNDGDALYLATKLAAEGKLRFQVMQDSVDVFYNHTGVWVPVTWTFDRTPPNVAFRYAIVRAAAEIGKLMESYYEKI